MLRSLRVEGYKSFLDTEVEFRPLTVFVGSNGSGKSNLFDAIRLLSRFVNERTLLAAFEGHRGQPIESVHRAGRTLEQLLAAMSHRLRFNADVELTESTVEEVSRSVQAARERPRDGPIVAHTHLRYRLDLEQITASGVLRVRDESLHALRRDNMPKASRNAFLEREGQRLHLRREGGGHPFYHEIGLDHTIVSEPLYPPHFPHAVAFRAELAGWRVHRFEPSEIAQGSPLQDTWSVGRGGGRLAGFINRLAVEDPSELGRLTDRLRRLVPFVDGLQVEADSEGALQLRIIEDGVPLAARLASSGTLRILALLAALSPFSGATLVACEEAEASVHPRRLRELAEVLREASAPGRLQVLVNTHSSAFARLFEDEDIQVCERSGWETRFEPFQSAYGGLLRDAALDEAAEGR